MQNPRWSALTIITERSILDVAAALDPPLILKKTKTDYFNNIDVKNITDNKRFWNAVKPFFKGKSKTCNNIILNENDEAIKDGKEIANKFNKYFENIIKNLNLKKGTVTSLESQENRRIVKTKF